MRNPKLLVAALLLGIVLPCSAADDKDKTAVPTTPDKAAQAAMFDQVVDKITNREQATQMIVGRPIGEKRKGSR